MADRAVPPAIQPGSMRTITDTKLVTFAVGQQKKTRFQKQRDEREQKKKQDEEAAAEVYDSFVASFTEDDDVKTFVRGSTFHDDGEHGGKAGEIYKLDRRAAKMSEMDKIMHEMKVRNTQPTYFYYSYYQLPFCATQDKQESREASKPAPSHYAPSSSSTGSGGGGFSDKPPTASGKGSRQIDDFFSEIKQRLDNQADDDNGGGGYHRNYSHDDPPVKGSFDSGDPNTTNIYLGNLSPTTTGETLDDFVGHCD